MGVKLKSQVGTTSEIMFFLDLNERMEDKAH